MTCQSVHQAPSSNSPAQQNTSQFTPRPFGAEVQQNSDRPFTQAQTGERAFQQDETDNSQNIVRQKKSGERMQGMADQKKTNHTGLPDRLKSGIETLSGMSMDDVNVHYHSSKPAQLHALAYTQGSDIHVGPGQSKHLAHEAWHVVQQRMGRVKPTVQAQGVSINDDTALEHEADVMGVKALQISRLNPSATGAVPAATAIQRVEEMTEEPDVQGRILGTSGQNVRSNFLSIAYNKAFNTIPPYNTTTIQRVNDDEDQKKHDHSNNKLQIDIPHPQNIAEGAITNIRNAFYIGQSRLGQLNPMDWRSFFNNSSEFMNPFSLLPKLSRKFVEAKLPFHCTGQKIKIADIVDKYDALAPLTHSRAASGSRAAPLACLVDLRGCFESDQIHSEKHSWLGVYVFLYESVSDH